MRYDKLITEVDTTDNLVIRKAKESDLPALRKLILPGLKPPWYKMVQALRKTWIFLVMLVSTSFGFTNLFYGEFSLLIFLLIYGIEYVLIILAVQLLGVIVLDISCRDLKNWEVFCNKYVEGFWVAEILNEDEIVGSYALMQTDDPTSEPGSVIEIQRMAVSPHVRRRGIGMKIIRHAVENAKVMGYKSMLLFIFETQKAAIALCTKAGFETEQVANGLVKMHVLQKQL